MATRQHLKEVFEELVNLIDSWNDLSMDKDRGRDNDALCIFLWDDGSGFIGVSQTRPEHLNVQLEFEEIEKLEEYLADWLDLDKG